MEEGKAKAPDPALGRELLKQYKFSKEAFSRRIATERDFWKKRYSYDKESPSAWLFNSIVNKHADIIDNIPECVCLPREEKDREDAETLSKIIPVINERCGFEQTYSDNSWQKLRHGTAVYGVFWNNNLYEGLGDIDIRRIEIENLYWEAGVEDIQDSRNVFLCSAEYIDILKEKYPGLNSEKVSAEAEGLSREIYGDKINTNEKWAVVDWYYKLYTDEGEILHFCKFIGNRIIYSSQSDPQCENGWYLHGKYPFVFDIMYPCDGDVCGFGLISVGRSCQNYIDSLDRNLMNYSDWASRVRFWAKKSLGVNISDFCDMSKAIVEVEGDIDEEKLKRIEIGSIDSSVIDVKKLKIEELKETTGSRDISLGSSSGGVTAASAIERLQEAGAKFSRDGIENSCRACAAICALEIELIRQFYDSERIFRTVGENGEEEYVNFSASSLSGNEEGRVPYFDIEIKTRKRTPTERQLLNNFAKELYDSGAFEDQNISQTLIMLSMMDFDGIGDLREALVKRQKYLMDKGKNYDNSRV